MPFTFAHPAAVLPLRRLRFLQTVPLLIGTLMPDVPYFLPRNLWPDSLPDTHTLYGSFVVCLPLGVASLLLILALREPLTVMLGVRARWLLLQSLERFQARRWRWPITLLSLMIGAWSHLIWDSITHETGWTAARVSALSAPVSVFGWDTETSHLLQYVSSVLGLGVLAIWYRSLLVRAPRSVTEQQTQPRASWLTLAGISLAAVAVGVSRAMHALHAASYYHIGYLLLTRSIGCFLVLYVVAGVLTLLSRRLVPEPAR